MTGATPVVDPLSPISQKLWEARSVRDIRNLFVLMIYMPAGWGLHADGKIFLEDSQSVLLRRDGDRTLIGMLFRNRLQRVQFRRCLAQ